MKKLVVLRRFSQAFFLTLFIYILWSTTYPLKEFLPPSIFFKFNPLIMIITSISERVLLGGLSASIIMLVLTVVLGRFFCGWICPLGASIDIAGLGNKKSGQNNKRLTNIKFIVLIAVFVFAALGIQLAWVLDPMVIMARFISLNFIPFATFALDKFFILIIKWFRFYVPLFDFYRGLKGSILGINIYYFSHSLVILLFFLIICALTLFMKRFWCRNICPLGALYAVFEKFSWLKRVVDKCPNCLICHSKCRMGAINEDLSYEKGECILCMDCIYDCPENATRFKFTK